MPVAKKVHKEVDDADKDDDTTSKTNSSDRRISTSSDHTHEVDEEAELEKKKIHHLAMHPDNPEWSREQSIRYFFKVPTTPFPMKPPSLTLSLASSNRVGDLFGEPASKVEADGQDEARFEQTRFRHSGTGG